MKKTGTSCNKVSNIARTCGRNIMGIPKTFLFMVSNLITFTVSLFVSWISFSVLATLSDDPFIYGTWPDVVAAASLQRALSLIIGEIVSDFLYEAYWIAIPGALIISWRGARGYLKGIAKEHQVWTFWYRQQENAITEGNMLEESPLASENMGTDSYFRRIQSLLLHLLRLLMFFIVHFSCWYSAFALLAIIMQPGNGIREAAYYVVSSFPDIAIPAVIHAFLSNYYEVRGNIKGTTEERRVWTKWYDAWVKWHHRQQGAEALGYTLDEPSPSLNPY